MNIEKQQVPPASAPADRKRAAQRERSEKMEFIEVKKFDLKEGEELGQLIRSIHEALGRHRERTNKSIILSGIYKGFIIGRDLENGRLFKMVLKRADDGTVELGDSEEVRQVYVPVKAKEEKAEDGETALSDEQLDAISEITEKAEAPEYVKVEKAGMWQGLLG